LFVRYNGGENMPPTDMDRMSRYLMHVIGIKFANKKWHTRLPKGGLDPQDAAQSLLMHLLKKMRKMKLRHPCWKVLLAILYRECHFGVMTMLESGSNKRRALAASTISTSESPDESGPMYSPAKSECPDFEAREFSAYMRRMEPSVIDDIKGDARSIQATYRLQCRSVARNNSTISWGELPKSLRKNLCSVQHGWITHRVVKLVEAYSGKSVYREVVP
jgi:hypothetical protein